MDTQIPKSGYVNPLKPSDTYMSGNYAIIGPDDLSPNRHRAIILTNAAI